MCPVPKAKSATVWQMSVSYTHLDVYKRQERREADLAKKLGGLGKGLNAIFIENDSETEGGTCLLYTSNHSDNSYFKVTIDTGNYREKREKTLEILGRKLADVYKRQPLISTDFFPPLKRIFAVCSRS